jgi:hypothetical protein
LSFLLLGRFLRLLRPMLFQIAHVLGFHVLRIQAMNKR